MFGSIKNFSVKQPPCSCSPIQAPIPLLSTLPSIPVISSSLSVKKICSDVPNNLMIKYKPNKKIKNILNVKENECILLTGDKKDEYNGWSIAIADDGNRIISGSPNSNNRIGSVYIFSKNDGEWIKENIVANDYEEYPEQGNAVDISADGNTIVFSGPFDKSGGSVWVHDKINDNWVKYPKLSATNQIGISEFGSDISISANGKILAIGGSKDDDGVGATWIYNKYEDRWLPLCKLIGSNYIGKSFQGSSISLSSNGNTLAVGAMGDNNDIGATWIFNNDGDDWVEKIKLIGSNYTGSMVGQGCSVSVNDDTLAVGGLHNNDGDGAVWIFRKNEENEWKEEQLLLGRNKESFGSSVSLSNKNLLAVGALNYKGKGTNYIYKRKDGKWKLHKHLINKMRYGNEGSDIDISETGVVVSGIPNNNQIAIYKLEEIEDEIKENNNCKCDKNCLCISYEPTEYDKDMTLQLVYHLVYDYIIVPSFFNNCPDFELIVLRLNKNQEDIGKLFALKYGNEIGCEVTKLLKEHISLAMDAMNAMRNNENNLQIIIDCMYKNACVIGDFLNKLLNTTKLKKDMKKHIDTMLMNMKYYHENKQSSIIDTDEYFKCGMKMIFDMLC